MDTLPDNSTILLSRTDSIGDVVLTLPMAGYLKSHFPKCRIVFLGRRYTRDVVALSEHVDHFVDYDEIKTLSENEQVSRLVALKIDYVFHVYPRKEIALLADKAGISTRVGTMSRLYHWYTCNRKIHLPRKNSRQHEATLNLKMLGVFGLPLPALETIQGYYGFTHLPVLPDNLLALVNGQDKINLILHPHSKGSAREWGLKNFNDLIERLPEEKYKVFISGTDEEGKDLGELFIRHPNITNLCGKMHLKEFIAFINACDAMVAASTGPLHIAAALGKKAIGLYAPMRPIHPGRWKPLGPKAIALALDKKCEDCKTSKDCHCIREIRPEEVLTSLENL
ncbi:MAG TPA: glycosyltransferase family 9 protein [Bacteroidia bacterium]|nr:glycosyltransferase family 9 protein [Bacteroidia bacterium]